MVSPLKAVRAGVNCIFLRSSAGTLPKTTFPTEFRLFYHDPRKGCHGKARPNFGSKGSKGKKGIRPSASRFKLSQLSQTLTEENHCKPV